MSEYVDIVFDGPPSHESGRFVEVENSKGASINLGEWVQRDDGFWALRITAPQDEELAKAEALLEKIEKLPGKWREAYASNVITDGPVWRAAADELDAILRERSK